MKDEDEIVAAPVAPAGKSKVLPMLLVVNTLLLTGVLIFVMKKPSAQAAPGAEKAAAATAPGAPGAPGVDTTAPGPTFKFDNFTIQLKSAEVDRYAHLAIEMELADDASKAVVEKRVAPIRDLIIGYLSDRTSEELRGSEGLKLMKEALLKKLEVMVPGHRIRSLFITNFIIQ